MKHRRVTCRMTWKGSRKPQEPRKGQKGTKTHTWELTTAKGQKSDIVDDATIVDIVDYDSTYWEDLDKEQFNRWLKELRKWGDLDEKEKDCE